MLYKIIILDSVYLNLVAYVRVMDAWSLLLFVDLMSVV